MADAIQFEASDGVAVITINRPEVRNAMDKSTSEAMDAALTKLDESDDVTVGILTGAEGSFSAGMDLKALSATGERPIVEGRGAFGIVERPPAKPLIAAVEGAALGGGLEIALACDCIVAAEDARLGLPEVKRGLVAAAGGVLRLPGLMPRAVALEVILSGEPLSTERAHQLGLVNKVTPPGGALDGARELAAAIAANGPLAVKIAKQIVVESGDWTATEAWAKQGPLLEKVRNSEDAKEGVQAFVEKREPNWEGQVMAETLTAPPRRPRELFDDDHEAYRESFRTFLEREVTTSYGAWRKSGVPRDLFAKLGSHQFIAASVPEEHGGAGIDDFRFGAVTAEEAMSANAAGLALALVSLNEICVPLLVAEADGDAAGAWLEGLASGEIVAALAAPTAPLTAKAGGDGLVIDGSAPAVVNGGLADLVLAAARTEDGKLALVAVEADAAGLTRSPSPALVGPKACDRADLSFDGVEAPEAAVLSTDAEAALEERARVERLALAVMSVAGSRAALAETLAYVHDRRAFGIPIAEFENTRIALGSVAAEIESTEAFVDACVADLQRDGGLTPARAAAAKLQATELFGRTVDWCLQLHGGYGYMLEYPIAHTYADARYLRLHGGSSEEMKAIVAGSIGL